MSLLLPLLHFVDVSRGINPPRRSAPGGHMKWDHRPVVCFFKTSRRTASFHTPLLHFSSKMARLALALFQGVHPSHELPNIAISCLHWGSLQSGQITVGACVGGPAQQPYGTGSTLWHPLWHMPSRASHTLTIWPITNSHTVEQPWWWW